MEEEEEDFFGGGGRRFTMGGSQVQASTLKDDSKRLYGTEGHTLHLKCMQLILKQQVQWLIKHQNAPAELENVARGLFGLFIDSVEDSGVSLDDNRSKNEAKGSKSAKTRPKINLGLMNTVAISYLSCVMLRLPIYVYDLLRWIAHFQFPYMQGPMLIPREMLAQVGMNVMPNLRPKTIPVNGQLAEAILETSTYFSVQYKVQFPQIIIQPLLFKMLKDMFLPREYMSAVPFCSLLIYFSGDFSCRLETFANQ